MHSDIWKRRRSYRLYDEGPRMATQVVGDEDKNGAELRINVPVGRNTTACRQCGYIVCSCPKAEPKPCPRCEGTPSLKPEGVPLSSLCKPCQRVMWSKPVQFEWRGVRFDLPSFDEASGIRASVDEILALPDPKPEPKPEDEVFSRNNGGNDFQFRNVRRAGHTLYYQMRKNGGEWEGAKVGVCFAGPTSPLGQYLTKHAPELLE